MEEPNKADTLARALQKLVDIRETIEELKGPDSDYAVVEAGLKEIERILDA